MASGTTSGIDYVRKIFIPCGYFYNGVCIYGSRCPYSHDRRAYRLPTYFCDVFGMRNGGCVYGNEYARDHGCVYQHVGQSNSTVSAEATDRGAPSSSMNNVHTTSMHTIYTEVHTTSNMADNVAEMLSNTHLEADAQEFIPSSGDTAQEDLSSDPLAHASRMSDAKQILCPYNILGKCWDGDQCLLLHGTICDVCDRPALHPTDDQINRKHRQECLSAQEHERQTKDSFAVAGTKEMQCGICMEIILEKTNLSARRFGILSNCKHCFCLDCIRKWRQAKAFENKIIRACPECRTVSNSVYPSTVWVEDEDEKRALIESYKTAWKEKLCNYFRHGTVVRGDSPRSTRFRQLQLQRHEGYEFSNDDYIDWFRLTDLESDYYDY